MLDVNAKELLTVKDLEQMGYGSRSTIERAMRRGELPYIKFNNGRVRFPKSAVEEMLFKARSDYRLIAQD